MYYIGLMSGTSMDAVDAALVEFDEKTILKFYNEYPIDSSLKNEIRRINKETNLIELAKLDNKLGHFFADAANDLMKTANVNPNQVKAIGSHGQTILHLPTDAEKTSIQISDPNIICAKTGVTTVADFRRMDMAYGGQGAPLASSFHEYQFRNNDKSIAILNIGGFANLTLLPSDEGRIIGFDTGPGNTLLDAWIKKNKNCDFDENGLWADSGKADPVLLKQLLSDNYFSSQIPKSTGKEYFNLNWLDANLKKLNKKLSSEDIQATLLKLTAITITDDIMKYAYKFSEVIICGGGTKNTMLIKIIKQILTNFKVTTTSDYGLSPDCIEAVTFAWLAKKRLENQPSNIPTVTGATERVVLGGIYSPIKKNS